MICGAGTINIYKKDREKTKKAGFHCQTFGFPNHSNHWKRIGNASHSLLLSSQVHTSQGANSSCRSSLRFYPIFQYELTGYLYCPRRHTFLAGSRILQIKGDIRVTRHEHVFRVSRYSSLSPGSPHAIILMGRMRLSDL